MLWDYMGVLAACGLGDDASSPQRVGGADELRTITQAYEGDDDPRSAAGREACASLMSVSADAAPASSHLSGEVPDPGKQYYEDMMRLQVRGERRGSVGCSFVKDIVPR